MSRLKLMVRTSFAVAFALLLWGCSGKNDKAAQFNPTTGQHPATWLQGHYADYVKTPNQCVSCHGSTSDPASTGGIAKVSCFTCHADGVNHPAGWDLPAQHGVAAEQAPVAQVPYLVPAMAGFAHCAKCHGADYNGGITSVSCKACHKKAPHPDKPWVSLDPTKPNHTNTYAGNAPECFKCHANGANFTGILATPAPAGTAPGCYNNTMCHGTSIPARGPITTNG
jgi:hypothetical protein